MSNYKHLVLLVNLGSPDKLEVKSIRLFLKRFLSDRRVVGLPRLLWYPILYGIILPIRANKLVAKYQKIWLVDENLSPLIHYSNQQASRLKALLEDGRHGEYIVKMAFLYSKPCIKEVFSQLVADDVPINSITVIPFYPQYSSTTVAPVLDEIYNYYKYKKYVPQIKFINSFCSNELYINAVSNKIQKFWEQNRRGELLVFSYHSLPVSLIKAGDTYYQECIKTTQLIANQLGLKENEYKVAFQSRFGASKWLTPATIDLVRSLAIQGVKHLDVVCPGFICDCLETLEEIAIVNKVAFINAGGVSYNYIECLNDDVNFTKVLKQLLLNL